MTTLLRIQHQTGGGMWYTNDGIYQGIITTIEGAKSAALPMPYDDTFQDGGTWLSAVRSAEELLEWFSTDDILELNRHGFLLMQLEVPSSAIRTINNHPIFLQSAVLDTTEILFPAVS